VCSICGAITTLIFHGVFLTESLSLCTQTRQGSCSRCKRTVWASDLRTNHADGTQYKHIFCPRDLAHDIAPPRCPLPYDDGPSLLKREVPTHTFTHYTLHHTQHVYTPCTRTCCAHTHANTDSLRSSTRLWWRPAEKWIHTYMYGCTRANSPSCRKLLHTQAQTYAWAHTSF